VTPAQASARAQRIRGAVLAILRASVGSLRAHEIGLKVADELQYDTGRAGATSNRYYNEIGGPVDRALRLLRRGGLITFDTKRGWSAIDAGRSRGDAQSFNSGEKEREAIVMYLKCNAGVLPAEFQAALVAIADDIERGDHLALISQ
jgi:hypothetical protein